MGSAPSILIVDNSSNDVSTLKRAFKKAGVANPIFSVSSGRDAMAYLQSAHPFEERAVHPVPSVILLDLQLPGEDGFKLLRWIRNEFPSGGLLVVALTRAEELRKLNRAYSLGANSFLTKPGNAGDVQELIRIFSGYWLLRNPLPELPYPESRLEKLFQ